jgi:hypothetical protein
MASHFIIQGLFPRRWSSLFRTISFGVFALGWFTSLAMAKEPGLTAIELYDGPAGASYLELSEVLINGKVEMRECASVQATDKSSYSKLPKLTLAVDGILERGADGVLRYSSNEKASVCVVPVNVKFEKKAIYSRSQMADFAVLTGNPITAPGETAAGAAPLNAGVKLIFVAAPDVELAEFLRAQRASEIKSWQNYLSRFRAAPHAEQAKLALTLLYVAAGKASMDAYQKSESSPTPSYSDLKDAKAQADQAHAILPHLASYEKLEEEIRSKLSVLAEKGRDELNSYHAALKSHAAGYSHLQAAGKFSDTIADIDPELEEGRTLLEDVHRDDKALESALQSADSAVKAQQFDMAFTFILPYRAFAPEVPGVAAVVDAVYHSHLERGKKFELAQEWQNAITEFEKAVSTTDTAEARDSLKNAHEQLVVAQDKAAAENALANSREFERKQDIIQAYEVLSVLPTSQRALVSAEMERLKPLYVQSASQEAKNLRQVHNPIHGLADEIAIENACTYLQSAYELSGNDSYRDRMGLLGNDLSAYLLNEAKRYLAKPAGSGTELGWTYLSEALPYKAKNLDAVRDAMTSVASTHAMRSKLSIRVHFRDETSQRDSAGFAGQLENAIIAGLESSDVPVKVVRSGETTVVDPDFQLDGDVIQHHISLVPTVQPQESKYLAGEHEVPNEEWNKINRAYEAAGMELRTAQSVIQGAEKKGNNKDVADLNQVATAMKRVEDLHIKLDSTARTVTTDVIRNYTYTKRTVDLSGIVRLQFRIGDSLSGQMAEAVPISKEAHQQYVLLENVKPEDTEGVKVTGTVPDSVEFLTGLESSALDALVAAVRSRVEQLPRKIYEAASSRETEGDLDGAGESYLRFLKLTRSGDSTERKHAQQFLLDQFNMQPASNISR